MESIENNLIQLNTPTFANSTLTLSTLPSLTDNQLELFENHVYHKAKSSISINKITKHNSTNNQQISSNQPIINQQISKSQPTNQQIINNQPANNIQQINNNQSTNNNQQTINNQQANNIQPTINNNQPTNSQIAELKKIKK